MKKVPIVLVRSKLIETRFPFNFQRNPPQLKPLFPGSCDGRLQELSQSPLTNQTTDCLNCSSATVILTQCRIWVIKLFDQEIS